MFIQTSFHANNVKYKICFREDSLHKLMKSLHSKTLPDSSASSARNKRDAIDPNAISDFQVMRMRVCAKIEISVER